MALTPKQQRFVDEYPIDLDPGAAYRRAGYKVNSNKAASNCGLRLLENVGIAAAIMAAREAMSKRTEITQDYVLKRLRENVERAMQAEAVVDREGKVTGEYQYAGAVANKALELLGKHLGMFKEEVKHKHGGDADAPPVKHDHTGTVIARVDALADAYERAARREETGDRPGDSDGKPVGA